MKTAVLVALLAFGCVRLTAAADDPPTEVVYLDHAKVEGAFSKGLPLINNNRSYKIHASRRVTAGIVEIHEHDTDIFHVVEGTATLVTGGTLADPKTIGPGEIRARESTGGATHHLAKGDVIVIPKGVPHWFKEVSETFLYLTVRVTS